jgi:uncharacterized protein (DUF1501 family)
MDRRYFLKSTSLASSAWLAPKFLTGLAPVRTYRSRSEKILIVIQLSGGNDGINTFVPFRNDLYYKNRPTIGLEKSEITTLTDTLAINNQMEPLLPLFDSGEICVINNVGYPNPNRSHFRSMDIWHSASHSDQYLSSGWIGRFLDSECEDCVHPYSAIEVDNNLSLVMKGVRKNGFALENPNVLHRSSNNPYLKLLAQQHAQDHHGQASYLYKTLIETQESAEYLYKKSQTYQSRVSYPQNEFGRHLKLIAELITADTDTRIYYASLGGFDTHANQKNRHNQLLRTYVEGLEALVKDLKQNNVFQDTLVLTFSEFGRRVEQNASGGTDHGTANNVILAGGSLNKSGILNEGPDLRNLVEGDLVHSVDFRSVYAEILDKWLKASSGQVLSGKFDHLNFL